MFDIRKMKAPFIMKETVQRAYSYPYAVKRNDSLYLFHTIADKDEGRRWLAFSVSDDYSWYTVSEKINMESEIIDPAGVIDAEETENGLVLYVLAADRETVYSIVTTDMRKFSSLQIAEHTAGQKRHFSFSDTDKAMKEIFGESCIEGNRVIIDDGPLFAVYYWGSGKGAEDGSIGVAVTGDGKHFTSFAKDKATYPDNGVIYEGDYCRSIPFGEYIHREPVPEGLVFDIRNYGAVGDGSTLSTEAFRAAAEAAQKAGGGTILVTGGYYCTGSVRIYDNTTLFVDMDAALCASKDLSKHGDAFISSVGCRNISIRGGGKMIGNGEYFVYLPLKKPLLEPLPYTKLPPVLYDAMGYPVDTIRYAYRSRIRYNHDRYAQNLPTIQRPMYNLWIRDCDNVVIENFIIEDSLDWTLDIDYSRNVYVKDVVINGNRHVANTDGIDVMCSNHVTVDHCFISCADDGLCVKAPRKQGHDDLNIEDEDAAMGGVSDVHFSNCTVMSVMNAFKIGTETYFDISDITVENCKFLLPDIYPGGVSGISIESSDSSIIRNVQIRNIEMQKICCPVYIGLNMRNKFGFEDEADKQKRFFGGSIENVVIENVEAYDVEVPCIITGFRTEHEGKSVTRCVNDISIKNFSAVYRDNDERLDIKTPVFENVTDYPENNAMGDVPAYGFYIRHGRNVKLEDCRIIPRSMNTRECIVREDAE